MIKVPTENGEITISDAVFTTITGAAATNCFGVKGMAQRSMTDGLCPSSCTSSWKTASTSPQSADPLWARSSMWSTSTPASPSKR